MDSKLFEGVDEAAKAKFIGNFFHFVKCRFQDCNNLVQTKSHLNLHKLSNSPTAAESKTIEDKKNHDDWAKQGNNTPSHNGSHPSPA